MTKKRKSFENNVGNGENAGNQHFLLFLQCFLSFPKQISIFLSHLFCCLYSAFNFDLSRTLWFDYELRSLSSRIPHEKYLKVQIQDQTEYVEQAYLDLLSLTHNLLCFCKLKIDSFRKILCEKEKMLVISYFSFSNNTNPPPPSKLKILQI